MIEVTGLSKSYGKKDTAFKALDDVNFSIPEGTTAAIIGKSGSGKSTLMHLMSGLDRPSRGSVTIGKRHLHTLSQKEVDKFRARDMSFIFQAFFIEPNQTSYQNVMLPLEIAKVPHRKRKPMVLEALEQVELQDKVNERARNLSGGQKQRLAIARAVVHSPKLIFADEPTGNLDSVTGKMIIDLLFELNATMGSTLIMVTHDVELARRCQMQIMLKDGKVERIHHGVLTAPSPGAAPASGGTSAATNAATSMPRPKPIGLRPALPPTKHKPLAPAKPVPAPANAAAPSARPVSKPGTPSKPASGVVGGKGAKYVS